jgi:hypothetical protein
VNVYGSPVSADAFLSVPLRHLNHFRGENLVKKVFGILAIVFAVAVAFGIVSKHAEAGKAVFSTGSQDELELAKQKSLAILHDRAASRSRWLTRGFSRK